MKDDLDDLKDGLILLRLSDNLFASNQFAMRTSSQ